MTPPRLALFAAVAALALASRGRAQELPPLPPCDAPTADAPPCQARYDTPPVLEPQPAPAGRGARGPRVWMLVDEAGAVRNAHVDLPTGVDRDVAALARARQFRFRPAMLAGAPVAAWVLMEVEAVPPPATCADESMRVPLSAGALFADSAVLERASLGTRYTYDAMGLLIDVFIYPHKEGETPRGEVERVLGVAQSGAVAGGPTAVSVVRAGDERVRPGGRFREPFAGYSGLFRGSLNGTEIESYVAVFPAAGRSDLKVRATWPRSVDGMARVRGFLGQFLGAEANRIHGCPR